MSSDDPSRGSGSTDVPESSARGEPSRHAHRPGNTEHGDPIPDPSNANAETDANKIRAGSGMLILAILIGLGVGALLGTQPSVNGSLGKVVARPLQASMISFLVGTGVLFVMTVAMGQFPPRFTTSPASLPWWIWTGGAIGVVVVSTSLFFVPRVGSLPWVAALMTGQVIAAVVLDHYGLLGNPKSTTSVYRLLGTLLLVGGVLTIVAAKHHEQSRAESANQPDSQIDEAPPAS